MAGLTNEGPIKVCDDAKPEAYTVVRLFLADGTTVAGIWTGKVWWAAGQEVFPERWRTMVSVGMARTDKD